MQNIKAAVFDMDGLMVDTERLWVESMLEAGKSLNIDFDQQYLISLTGLRHDLYDNKLKKDFGKRLDVVTLRQVAQKIFDQKIANGEINTKTGINQLLAYFKKIGLVMAIASSSDIDMVKMRLKLIGLDQYFGNNIIGGDMVKKAKPNPEVYIKSCRFLGMKPENVVALEDSDVGIEAASKAGLVAIHIPDLKPATKETRRYAYKTFDSLLEVIDLFDNR